MEGMVAQSLTARRFWVQFLLRLFAKLSLAVSNCDGSCGGLVLCPG